MPKLLKIITNPNKILRKKSLLLDLKDINSKEVKELLSDMVLTMQKKDGVGLAAPQIGKNIRIAVINTKDGPCCLINPKLSKKSWLKEWGEEGCLSVPDFTGKVIRAEKITLKAQDLDGKEQVFHMQGYEARAVQHEIDHLDGLLFLDRLVSRHHDLIPRK